MELIKSKILWELYKEILNALQQWPHLFLKNVISKINLIKLVSDLMALKY
jgi:hypothetical protein